MQVKLKVSRDRNRYKEACKILCLSECALFYSTTKKKLLRLV